MCYQTKKQSPFSKTIEWYEGFDNFVTSETITAPRQFKLFCPLQLQQRTNNFSPTKLIFLRGWPCFMNIRLVGLIQSKFRKFCASPYSLTWLLLRSKKPNTSPFCKSSKCNDWYELFAFSNGASSSSYDSCHQIWATTATFIYISHHQRTKIIMLKMHFEAQNDSADSIFYKHTPQLV